jgi:tetratricopeptide (TPR) repeat protein
LDLLRLLGRRLHRAAVLLICTYRDDALPTTHPLRLVLGELAVQRSTRRIERTPLSAEAVGILASGSELDATQLHRLTGGNPFYVTAALQAQTGEVPASARDAVLARVAMLRKGSRQVLDVAALIGTRIELRLLELVTTCPPSVIDELLASGLLQEEDRALRFRHEIGRLAVDQAIGSHRRVPAHARILEALAALGCTDDVRMAFHAEAAGNDAAVLKHAVAAARRARELASHRESAAQYERALRFSINADDLTSAALCDELADELSLIDRLDEAAATLERALDLWRSARNRLREGDSMRRLSLAMARLCRGHESMAAGESALAILRPLGPTVELAWAYANLANRFMVVNEHAAAIDMAHRAQSIAEPLGLVDVLSDALNTEACVAATTGQEWTPPLSRALDIALTARLDEQAGRAYANFHATYCDQRRFAEADRYFVEGIAHCQEHEIHTFATCLEGERAGMLEKTGRWDEAVAVLTELLDQATVSPGNRLCALMRLGSIRRAAS